jgi:hypothetical protein
VPDKALRNALEQEMRRRPLSFIQASVTLPDGWTESSCANLLRCPDSRDESAALARGLGGPVADF